MNHRLGMVALLGALSLGLLGATCAGQQQDGTDAGTVVRACTARTDCSADEVCNAGLCIPGECERREDCPHPLDQLCNELFTCQPDPESPLGNQCPEGDLNCHLGQFCSAGTCYDTEDRTACQRPSQCSTSERCDPRAGFCVPNKGGCDRCAEYPELCCIANEEACDPETKRCRLVIHGTTCTPEDAATTCRPNEHCVLGRCVQCVLDSDCGPGTLCNAATGTCVSNSTCQSDADCVQFPGRRCSTSTHECTVPECTTDAQCSGTDPRARCNPDTFKCFLPPATCTETDEPNDSLAQATPLTPSTAGFHGTASLCRGNNDYVSFPVEAHRRIDAVITLNPGAGGEAYGVGLRLLGPDGATLAESVFSYGGASKRISGTVATAGTAYVVLLGNGAGTDSWAWTMDVTLGEPLDCEAEPGEPNETLAQASNSVLAGPITARALCAATDVDHHLFHAGPARRVVFTVEPDSGNESNVQVSLLDAAGTELDSASYASPLQVSARTPGEAQDLVLKVSVTEWAYDVAYPVVYTVTAVETELPTCDDLNQEPNDVQSQAFPIAPGSTHGTLCDADDVDWYSITLAASSNLTLQLNQDGDTQMDLRLHDSSGNTIAWSDYGSPPTLTVTGLAAGTYGVDVVGYSWFADTFPAPYSLVLTAPGYCTDDSFDAPPGNDSAQTAAGLRDLVDGPLAFSQDLRVCPADQDWFRVVALPGERITATAAGTTPVQVAVQGPGTGSAATLWRGHQVVLDGGLLADRVTVPVARAGLYFVSVTAGAGASGAYHLNVNVDADICAGLGAEAESNDAPDNALAVQPGTNAGLLCPREDVDLWKLQAAAGDLLVAAVAFDATDGDVDVALWKPGQAAPLATQEDVNAPGPRVVQVRATAPAGGIYLVAVTRKPGGKPGQAYSLEASAAGGAASSSSGATVSSSSSGPVPSSSSAEGLPSSSSSAPDASSSAEALTSSSAAAPSSAAPDASSSSEEALTSSSAAPSSSAPDGSSSSAADAVSSSGPADSSSSADPASSAGP